MTNENIIQNKKAWAKYRKNEARALRAVRNCIIEKDRFNDEYAHPQPCFFKKLLFVGLICLSLFIAGCFVLKPAHALTIDINKIAQIESSGCIHKNGDFGKSIGCYQVKDALIEWNIYHPLNKYSRSQMLVDSNCLKVADWYLHKRIPQMLRSFKKPVTTRNILIAYNAGISYVVKSKKLPAITVAYLRKYGVA